MKNSDDESLGKTVREYLTMSDECNELLKKLRDIKRVLDFVDRESCDESPRQIEHDVGNAVIGVRNLGEPDLMELLSRLKKSLNERAKLFNALSSAGYQKLINDPLKV